MRARVSRSPHRCVWFGIRADHTVKALESGSCLRLSYAQGVNRLIYDAFNPQDHVQPCLMFDVFLSSPGLWRNSCPAPVRDRHCILIAHRSAVTALNSLQVPHIFNHFDCHLSNAAKTCCNFSHSLTLESRSPIKGLPRSLGFSLSYLPSFLFHDVSFSPRLSQSASFLGPCVSVLSPSLKELWYLWPVKWTCVPSAAQMRNSLQYNMYFFALRSFSLPFLFCLAHSVASGFFQPTAFTGKMPPLFVQPREKLKWKSWLLLFAAPLKCS